MNTNMVLFRQPEGGVVIGVSTPIGTMPIMSFPDLESLERFAMGIVGYCQYFKIPIPDVWLKGWDKKEGESCQLKLM